MATQDDTINFQFTSQGQALAAQALAGKTKLDFTKAVASTDNHFTDTASTALALTSIGNVTQTVAITEVDTVGDDDSQVKIPVVFNKADVTADYNLLTIGLYCKPDDGDEQLYAICALQEPIYMHKSTTDSQYSIDMYVIVGTSSNVTIKVNPAGEVTHADLTTILGDYAKTADVTKTLADYEKSADTVKTLVDYAKTGDVNQQLDKKVNVSDMRKPASDVAGIEEVNAKQDKIGYTPADDSKVLHSTVTELNSTDMNTVKTAGLYQLISGTNGMPNADRFKIYQVIPLNDANGVQVAYETNKAILGMRSWNGWNDFTNWVQFADDSKVVHISDMRQPANQVAGIDEVNAKQDKLDYTPANAANAVARNPDTGVVSEPTDFTNLTVNGGKTVATSDDLKSLEASAWLSLGMPKGSYKTSNLSIDSTLLGSPLYMKYDTDTEITTLSGSFLLFFNGNTRDIRSWEGTLITLPDGFYVSDEDLNEFVKFLVGETLGVGINSASKSGNDIMVSLNYNDYMVPSGYSFGITVSGAYGANYRQYVTSKTTKLIKKV